ncbi:MAG: iron-sulfur cluster assembly scaffold protein [Pseudomonadota bacterium]
MTAAQADLMRLYSERILALAAALPHAGRLEGASGTAKRRSPLCGSTVTVDVTLDAAGRVSGFAQDVKACALGQSSAAVLGQTVVGLNRDEISAGRDQLYAMLKSDGAVPAAPFAELEALLPARDYKNRHASIMLAWDATLAAMDDAG